MPIQVLARVSHIIIECGLIMEIIILIIPMRPALLVVYQRRLVLVVVPIVILKLIYPGQIILLEKPVIKLNVHQAVVAIFFKLTQLRRMLLVIPARASIKMLHIVIECRLIRLIKILPILTPFLVPLKVLPQAPRLD